jgi:hypothetical protein
VIDTLLQTSTDTLGTHEECSHASSTDRHLKRTALAYNQLITTTLSLIKVSEITASFTFHHLCWTLSVNNTKHINQLSMVMTCLEVKEHKIIRSECYG